LQSPKITAINHFDVPQISQTHQNLNPPFDTENDKNEQFLLIVSYNGQKLGKIKSVKIPMTLCSAMRLAKPNDTKRLVPYNFSWLLSPKIPFGGQSGVQEVNFGDAHNIFTKNYQKRQIKAVLSIFENYQK